MRAAILLALPSADAARRGMGWPPSDPFAASVARVAGACWLLAALGAAVQGLTLDYVQFATLLVAACLLLGVAAALRARALPRWAAAVEACTLFPAACLPFAVLSVVLATSAPPLVDAALDRADRLLLPGLDWEAAAGAFCGLGNLPVWADAAYGSLKWQPSCVMALLCLSGQRQACWRFLAAWIAGMAVTVAVFAVMPALGPYPYFGIAATDMPCVHEPIAWRSSALLVRLREGLRLIDMDAIDGIVIFPSFHAAGAVLLAWAWWPLRWLRWPALVGNAAMLLTAVPVGGHYFVDLPAGAAVAVLGILAARRWHGAVLGAPVRADCAEAARPV